MVSDITIVFAIVAAIIALFIWDRLPVIAVCVGCALALWATQVLTLNQSLAGFGDPATIFVASLFVVSAGLDKTGVTTWAGQVLIRNAGDSRARLIVLIMLACGLLSALISVNGAVAALLPVVVVMAVQLGRTPSKILMPLVFGAHAGSMLALTGTPVNVLVLEASLDAGAGGFGYFEFALVGVPHVAGCVLIAVLLGERLLPERDSRSLPPDLSRHARTLVEQFRLTGGVHRLKVREGSPLVGTPRRALDFSDRPNVSLMRREAESHPETIAAGDVLLLQGAGDAIAAIAGELRLSPQEELGPAEVEASLINREFGLAEVMIPPRSPLIGARVFPGMVTPGGDLVVLGLQRQGRDIHVGCDLGAGDTLLLQGSWNALGERLGPADVLVVDSPELVRRQAIPMGAGAKQMLLVLAAMVLMLATGLVPAAVAGLLAAGAVLLLGLLSVDEVYAAVNWTTVILVGAMLPLSTAIAETGAAELLADALVAAVGDLGPRALLAGLFLLTAVLGQVISNTATALIVIPIAVVAAAEMGISPQPILMAVAVGAAASFITPVATPTNLMIMEPAGYRFGDYWKFGLPMMIWFAVVAVGLVPVIWPF